MGRKKLPKPLKKRDVLYGVGTPREQLVRLGKLALQRGLVFDAADFFCEAKDEEGLVEIRRLAVEQGDAFLLRKIQETDVRLVSSSDWRALAAKANQLGKLTYSERAGKGGTPPPPPLQEEIRLGEAETDGGEGG